MLSTDNQHRYAIGLTLILLCATFFSLITTFSKFAYEAGSNPLTVVEARSVAFILVVAVYQSLQRRSLKLPRRTFIASFPMGLGILLMSVGYLSSVYFIKVSLAVVLLYSFPLLVGLLAAVSGRERIRLPKALALLVAFTGLVMAVGLETDDIDWRGIALVLMAALGIAGNLTFSGPYLEGVDSLTVNIWTNLWGALALGAFLALAGGVAWPATGFGWAMIGAVIFCYILGLGFMFGALKYLPPSQAAVMLNLEPVITIFVAVLWRGEALLPLQWLGVAIMLAALCFSALRGAKSEA
ncbi:DMT family transporter [Dongia sp. agr-C8]